MSPLPSQPRLGRVQDGGALLWTRGVVDEGMGVGANVRVDGAYRYLRERRA